MVDRDIICTSSHYWNEAWFRKQHFMSRLARQNRILYVEPSFPMVRERPHQHARNRWLAPMLYQATENLWRLQPPRKLPKWTYPWVTRINYYWYGRLIARAAQSLNFRDVLLWVYVSQYASALDVIPHRQLIFDLCDDYVAYNQGQPYIEAYTRECLRTLFDRANVVVTTTETLRDKYRAMRGDMIVIPNGVDYARFENALKTATVPEDIAKLPRPIIGFIGVLFSFLDYARLRETILKMPHASFVFVGRGEYTPGVNYLHDLANVYLLGNRPTDMIPAYVQSFDVCISPFKHDEVSRHVSPLKVYEYLACGKPVVSTPMEALAQSLGSSADSIICWDDPCAPDSTGAIERALATDSDALGQKRKQIARRFSWDSLFNKLETVLDERL